MLNETIRTDCVNVCTLKSNEIHFYFHEPKKNYFCYKLHTFSEQFDNKINKSENLIIYILSNHLKF